MNAVASLLARITSQCADCGDPISLTWRNVWCHYTPHDHPARLKPDPVFGQQP